MTYNKEVIMEEILWWGIFGTLAFAVIQNDFFS
jgi:hypothetical protein